MTANAEAEAIAAIDREMRATLADARAWLADDTFAAAGGRAAVEPLHGMMRYHLGWDDATFQPVAADGGKKLRGQLCLLACQAAGGPADRALPLAAAVELLHNFTLVHDDIQDRSDLRRHRPTVWAIWGVGQAINVGDGLFALARLALLRLAERDVPAPTVLHLASAAERTLLRVLEGQYLDLEFERDWQATVPLYLRMIAGKTAALIDFCLSAGALVGGADPATATAMARAGRAIGLGFQVRDDILGIWGATDVTGKPPAADLYARKKSLPVLLARESAAAEDIALLERAYAQPEPTTADVQALLALLKRTNAQARAQQWVQRYHGEALAALASVPYENEAMQAIRALAERLVLRQF